MPVHTGNRRVSSWAWMVGLLVVAVALPAFAAQGTGAHGGSTSVSPRVAAQLAEANRANAAFQDVEAALDAGYTTTLPILGCWESEEGGMGVHYRRADLFDSVVDPLTPEALVYELGYDGEIVGLVAHEYIIPVAMWDKPHPPKLFGQHFHVNESTNNWILHTWIWKDNPDGVFQDYNPKVRPCPEGVPVFGEF